jgi:hypothetical protein
MSVKPTPLVHKPDLEEAARRWEAYYAGEIIDRPLVCVTAPRQPGKYVSYDRFYWDNVFGDLNVVLDTALEAAEATYFGGESIPSFYPSLGPDAIAVFCGGELAWSDSSRETNWSVPFVEDWEQALPLRIQENSPLWQHQLRFYRLAAERLRGKMALSPLDLHTNMDLLSAVRGPARLCFDLLDRPELIDRAMESARAVFPVLWEAIVAAGQMDELGYCHQLYAMEGAAILQCDFSYMIGPEMFGRWVRPALEEEAAIVKHVYYHCDGKQALLTHGEALTRMPGLHTIQFQPGAGGGDPIVHLPLLKQLQARGKAVHFWGSPEECQAAHRELQPEKVMYTTYTATVAEAEALLGWFEDKT